MGLGVALIAVSFVVVGIAYVGYPAYLWLITRRRRSAAPPEPAEWPLVSITVPAYNEARTIAATLERLLELDYPADRRQVLVVSDASTDGTDEIVKGFAARGVELLRLERRAGKTAAENAAAGVVRGDIVVQTDASVRVDRRALKPLVAAFHDQNVGVASGRDVSEARTDGAATAGESSYVGYEMWVRDLETRAGGIVGASGCLYASRRALHRETIPESLSRDFAAPLIAREHGYRTVSVPDAVCYVPRTPSLRREYRRKVRTMARGLQTLNHKRHLLNPFRYGSFALRLWMHKPIRWLAPFLAVLGVAGLIVAAACGALWAQVGLLLTVAALVAALTAWFWPRDRTLPRLLSLPAYVVWGLVAGLHAWVSALRGERRPTWEPTQRA